MKAQPIQQSEESVQPPSHILVVEDDGDIRNFVVKVLIRSGYLVDEAEDGAVAWEHLKNNGYDLMITDNNMPRVTGVDLLRKLHAGKISMPVIMATGVVPADEFSRSPWIKPSATLLKPYTGKQLLQIVEKVLLASVVALEPSVPLPGFLRAFSDSETMVLQGA